MQRSIVRIMDMSLYGFAGRLKAFILFSLLEPINNAVIRLILRTQ